MEMVIGVHWCPLVSIGVRWCPLVSIEGLLVAIGVHWCPLVSIEGLLVSIGIPHKVQQNNDELQRNELVSSWLELATLIDETRVQFSTAPGETGHLIKDRGCKCDIGLCWILKQPH